MGYNFVGLDIQAVELLGPDHTGGIPTIDGNYMALLQGGSSEGTQNVSILQTGLLPAGANSIEFKAGIYSAGLIVSLNGQAIPFGPISTSGIYSTYAGSISQFAGKTCTLGFTVPPGGNAVGAFLDDITFSSQAIPEPAVISLFGIGGVAFAANFRPRRS